MSEPRTEEATGEEQTAHYTMGEWKEIPRYECAYCPWDVLEDERAMQDHTRNAHPEVLPQPPPPLTRAAAATMYDRFGNLIEEVPNG